MIVKVRKGNKNSVTGNLLDRTVTSLVLRSTSALNSFFSPRILSARPFIADFLLPKKRNQSTALLMLFSAFSP